MKTPKILFFILGLAFLLLSYNLDKPFIGHHDWNGVFFGNIVKNTVKFGFLKTKFGAVRSFLPQTEADFRFYTHYPPMFRIVSALLAKILGVHEWSLRLIVVLFSLLAIFLFFKLIQRLFNQKIAFIACLFFIFTPMFLYFGKMFVHEMLGLSLVIFSIYRYLIYFEKRNKNNFIYLTLVLILACQTVWSAYYLAPLFVIHYLFFKNKKEKKKDKGFFLIILIPLLSFLSHLIYGFILTGGWDKELFSTMLFRMQIGEKAAEYQFTLLAYLKKEALWLRVYFTRWLCFLSLIYYFVLGKKIVNKKKLDFKDGFILILFTFPFIDPIIFRNVCWIHEYKLYYFLLSLPLGGSLALFYLKNKFSFIWQEKQIISLILFTLVFTFFATERIEFTKTLLQGSMNKPAYDLGLIIQEKTKEGEVVLIGAPSFAEFLDLFLNFYGQRKVIYFQPVLKEFEENFSSQVGLVVFDKGREEVENELLEYLQQNFVSWQKDQFVVFDLRP